MKLIRKIQSIIPTYQKHGIDGLVYAILKNLKLIGLEMLGLTLTKILIYFLVTEGLHIKI